MFERRVVVIAALSIGALVLLLSITSPLTAHTAEPLQSPLPTSTEKTDPPPLPDKKQSSGSPDCALLDRPDVRGLMSGAFEAELLIACGRAFELGLEQSAPPTERPFTPGDDARVNNTAGDSGGSRTQSETTLARNPDNGVLCAAYNDSYHGVVQGIGYTGFSHSGDDGATWIDHGAIPLGGGGRAYGDPSNVWRRADGRFYHASLHSSGLGLWDLGEDCATATWTRTIHYGYADDKELMAVDNNPASPYYGRLYVVWTDFVDGHIYVTTSDDPDQPWSYPIDLSGHASVQGAWPAVDPASHDVYVGWVHWDSYPSGPIDIEIVRSTDGGATWNFVASPASNKINPRHATATYNCYRPALKGNIRYLPSPQIALDGSGNLHVVYSYDPDGYNTGDVVNVYYRRSTDHGATWQDEIQVNDDATPNDQWMPALAVNELGVVNVSWYDRRLDAANLSFDYFAAASYDNGFTFQPNQRVSDVSSPVVLDDDLATCYHGDYDTSLSGARRVYIQWSDDRDGTADVWFDSDRLLIDAGTLTGAVVDAVSAQPVPDAQVRASLSPTQTFTTRSDADGLYSFNVAAGTYTLTAALYGYLPAEIAGVPVAADLTTTQPISLAPAAQYRIDGAITDAATGDPLWATIRVDGAPFDPPLNVVQTDPATGAYSLTLAAGQSYTLSVTALFHNAAVLSLGAITGDREEDFGLLATTVKGGIAGYVTHYASGKPISDAQVVINAPLSLSATTDVSGHFQIPNLVPGYYTATATASLFGSVSLSNIRVVSSNLAWRTFSMPSSRLAYYPPRIEKTLVLGDAAADSAGLMITNTGVSTLTFDLAEQPGGYMPQRRPRSPNGSGGPDPSGYVFRTSDDAGGPVFDWIYTYDGEALDLVEDGVAAIQLPFPFELYGESHITLLVGNNGAALLGVAAGQIPYENADLASGDAPNFLIAPMWDDLGVRASGGVYWKVVGSAPDRKVVIEWQRLPHYPSFGSVTFEVVLYEGGDILYQYLDANFDAAAYDFGASATIGIRGSDAGHSLQYAFNTASLKNDFAVCFDSPSDASACGVAGVAWLSEAPIEGELPGGANAAQAVRLAWNAASDAVQQPGVYTSQLWLSNNDPEAQSIRVPVVLTVLPPATQGKLAGAISSRGLCDENPAALPGAYVHIVDAAGFSATLDAGADGVFGYWLDRDRNPYTLTVAYRDHLTATIGLSITAGATTTHDIDLRLDKPCVRTQPAALLRTLRFGQSIVETAGLIITNTGAGVLHYRLRDRGGLGLPSESPILVIYDYDDPATEAVVTALDNLGYPYDALESTTFETMPLPSLLAYHALIYVGAPWSDSLQAQVIGYLDAGGRLLITENDVGYFIRYSDFYQTYLQAFYLGDDGGDDIEGEDIMAGVVASVFDDPYPDYFQVEPQGQAIFRFSNGLGTGYAAGSRIERENYRAVYLAFDYNYLDTYAPGEPIETEVMQRSLAWLLEGVGDVPWLSQSPVTGTLPGDASASVDVQLTWNAGRVESTGVYTGLLYVLAADPAVPSTIVPVTMTVVGPAPIYLPLVMRN